MNYSRRQLYALGEPLGDSVTTKKVGGGRIYGGGGGGGGTPAPTNTTAYNTNVPEYAKPYVTNMLEATQQQLFNMGDTGITGFKPYKPYSTDVNNYVAGFSPLQQQAQKGIAGLQVPGAIGLGTMGSLMAGQNYAQNVTDPATMAAYMNPYQQGVTDIAKNAAVREAMMAQNASNLGAARQGTYGGARQTLANTERERNLLSNLSNIQTQGSNQAYNQALQSQQFGANLGMQGMGQAGQLAGQGLQAQQGIYGLQNQFGGEQQKFEQGKINQAIQDYATQQQYPLMQLGMMSNMLRGLPMQATTTQSYQATPPALTQGLGVLAGAAGAKQAGLFAEGGPIRGLAGGGAIRYADTGAVEANPQSQTVRGVQARLSMMSLEQLKQVAATSQSEQVREMANELIAQKEIQQQAEQRAEQAPRQMPQPQMPQGLAAAPAPSMDSLQAASGGIIAFADEGQVELDPAEQQRLQQQFLERQQYENFARKQREAAGIGAPKSGLADFYAKEQADIAEATKRKGGYDLLNFGVDLATQTGPLGYAGAKALKNTLPGMISREDELRGRRSDLAKGQAEIKEGERLMKQGDITAGNAMYEKGQERLNKFNIAGMKSPGEMLAYANNYLASRKAAGDTRDDNVIREEGMNALLGLRGAAGSRAATAFTIASGNLTDKAVDNVKNTLEDYNSPEAKQLRKLQKEDKKNGTRTAQTYKDSLVEKEIKRVQPSSSAGSNTGGGKNTESPALPAGFQRDKT